MMRPLSILLLLLTPILAIGCASDPKPEPTYSMSSPWTGSYNLGFKALAAVSVSSSSSLLADGDLPYGRGEKYIEGGYPMASVSASSVYTYDAQPIGLPGGTGYRYRSTIQNIISVP